MTSFPSNVNRSGDLSPAALWAAKLDAGRLSPDDEAAFSAWLEESPDNAAEIEEHVQIYSRLAETVPQLVRSGRWPEEDLNSRVVRPTAILWRWAGGIGAAAALTVAAVWWVNRPEVTATPIARRQSITLEDGSHVDLNARTSVAVRLRSSERDVELTQGEAYFSVAKDASRPFLVKTPAGTVRVTGTEFNIRVDGPTVEVVVARGSVAVSPAANSASVVALKPGDQLTLAEQPPMVRQLSPDALSDTLAWRQGVMVFDSEPLGLAVQRFARYHGREIEVSPTVANLELGGRFKLDDLDRFLSDLSSAVPVRAVYSGDGKIRIVGR